MEGHHLQQRGENIETVLTKIEWLYNKRIHMAHNMDKMWNVLNMVMSLWEIS